MIRLVAAVASIAVCAAVAPMGTTAAPGDTWTGGITYSDDTVVYEQLADEVTVTQLGVAQFSMSASLRYTTANDFCTFTWAKSFEGVGDFDAVRSEIVFDGVETIQNTSTCANANLQDVVREASVFANAETDGLSGFIFNGEFAVDGLSLGGIVERDGKLYLTAPVGGVLDISRADLPPWAQAILAVQGAMVTSVGPPDVIAGGDPTVLVDGLPVARLGDPTRHGGEIVAASDTIFVNGVPAAVIGSQAVCPMVTGSVPHVGGRIAMTGAPGDGATSTEAGRGELQTAFEGSGSSLEVIRQDVTAGSTTLDVDGSSFEIGDGVVIGRPDGSGESAFVAAKGSIVLDRPLAGDYPAGSFVVKVDAESAASIPVVDAAPDALSTTPVADGVELQTDALPEAEQQSSAPNEIEASSAADSAPEAAPESGSSSTLPVVVIVAAVLLLLGGGAVFVRRSR